MEKNLNILWQTNNNYILPTSVSMLSLLENNKDVNNINLFVLDDNLSQESKNKLIKIAITYKRELAFINTQNISKMLEELKVNKFRGGYTAYFKMFVLNNLKLNNGKVLYIDADTIVDGSLKELFDVEFGDCAIMATYDFILNEYKKIIEMNENEKYYNAGVLFFNQNNWIKYDYENRIINHIKNVRRGYYLPEQDLMNVLFGKEIKYLNIKYNFNSGMYIYGIKDSLYMYNLKSQYYSSIEEIEQAYKHPIIHHCMGAMTGRPWENKNIHPLNNLFNKYMSMLPIDNQQKLNVKRKLVFKIQFMLFRILPRRVYILISKRYLKFYLKKMNLKSLEV